MAGSFNKVITESQLSVVDSKDNMQKPAYLLLFIYGTKSTVARCVDPTTRVKEAATMIFHEKDSYTPRKDRLGLAKAKTFSRNELSNLVESMENAFRNSLSTALAEKQNRVSVVPGAYYRLGRRVEDVVSADVIAEAKEVYWCNVGQEWVESK